MLWAKIITLLMWFVSTHAFNTRKLNVSVATLTQICSQNQIPKCRGRGKVFNITGQNSRQLVPTFVAGSSGVYLEAPGKESGKYKELAQVAACQIRNVFLTGLFVMPNWAE